MGLCARLEVHAFQKTPKPSRTCEQKIGPRESILCVGACTERSSVAKAAAGFPVAVGLSHPKGSSPFPLRQFFVSAYGTSLVDGIGTGPAEGSRKGWRR